MRPIYNLPVDIANPSRPFALRITAASGCDVAISIRRNGAVEPANGNVALWYGPKAGPGEEQTGHTVYATSIGPGLAIVPLAAEDTSAEGEMVAQVLATDGEGTATGVLATGSLWLLPNPSADFDPMVFDVPPFVRFDAPQELTDAEKAQARDNIGVIPGEENVIEVVKVNGAPLTPDADKAVDVSVPEDAEDFPSVMTPTVPGVSLANDIIVLRSGISNKADSVTVDYHISRTDNPHSVTKAQVGLGNVDNTSDANKPVSTATQNALDGKADTEHGHAVSDVDGLQAALDGKLSTAAGAVGTANIANSAVTGVKIANNSATWAKLGSDAKNAINGKVDRNGDTMTGVLNLDAPGSATVYLSDYSFDGYISSYDGNMFQAAEEEGAQIHMMVSGSFSFEVYDPDAGEYITHTVDARFEMAWEYSGGWQYMGDAIDLDGYMFWPSMYTYDDDYGRCIDLQLDNYDYYISIYMYMEEQYAEEIQRDKVGPVVVEDEIAGFAKAEDVASAVSTAVASHDSSASAHSSLLALYAKYEPVYILKTSSSASATLTAPAWGREYTANMQSVGNKTYTIDLPDLQKTGVSDTASIAMSGYFSITGVVSNGTSIAVRYRYGVPSAGYHTANYTIYKPSDWTEWWGTKTSAIVRVCLHVFATKQYSGSTGTHYAPKIEIYLASPDVYNRGNVTDASFAGMSTKWDKVQ